MSSTAEKSSGPKHIPSNKELVAMKRILGLGITDEQYLLFAYNTIPITYWLHNGAIQYNINTRSLARKCSILVLNT